MIDDSGFYKPPAQSGGGDFPDRVLVNFRPNLPAHSPYVEKTSKSGEPVYAVGEVTGTLTAWRKDLPTPKSEWQDTGNVLNVDVDMPGTDIHQQSITCWVRHVRFIAALDWIVEQGGEGKSVTIRRVTDEDRQAVYLARINEAVVAQEKAGGKPTTASAWTALYHGKVAEGKSDTTLQRIIDAATADEFVWDGNEFISLLTDDAGAPPPDDDDDLPF